MRMACKYTQTLHRHIIFNKGDKMKLYELTDKGRARLKELRGKYGELWNVRHEEPTNYEHCCSCCAVLEKENRKLKQELQIWAEDREINKNE